MKMNYRRRNERGFRKIFLVFALALFLLGISFFSPRTNHLLAGIFHRGGSFLWGFRINVAEKSAFVIALLRSRTSLSEENLVLKRELEEANLKLEDQSLLEGQIQNLKNLLGRGNLSKMLPAMVLSRPPQTAYDFLIIDAGANLGLKGGEKVFFENVLLGEVEKVFDRTSRVKAFSSSGTEIHGFIERSNLPVTILGKGGGNFESKLPHEADVEEGDFVTIPAIDSHLSFIGQIEEVESNATGSFKRILLRYPFNLSALRWITVEMDGSNNLDL
jgi:cell shape-determining protein MreC